MCKFLIIDDHYIFRQGVKKIIAETFGHALFSEAGNYAEALAILHHEAWDLVILDINLPGRPGLDFISDARSFIAKLPVLVLTMYEEEQMALRALKAGANGFLCKTRIAEDLIVAISTILEGNHYINETVARLLLDDCRHLKSEDNINELSDREYFVLLRLSSGETVTEIARTLSLSVKTISTYRFRIMKKLRLKNMAELIKFVNEQGLTN